MTAVARVLPGDWDGHRLLRFLTGLAMLALAFAAHLTPAHLATAEPAPVSAVVAAQSEPAAAVATQSKPAAAAVVAQSGPASALVAAQTGSARADSVPAEAAAGAESLSSPHGLSAHWVMLVVAAPMAPAVALLTTVAAMIVLAAFRVRAYAVRGPPFP